MHREIILTGDSQPLFVPLPSLRNHGRSFSPFFIVHPSAMGRLDVVREGIDEAGLVVDSEVETDRFELFARYIYPVRMELPHSYLWLMALKEIYSESSNHSHAFVFGKEYLSELVRLDSIKRVIRDRIGIDYYRVAYQGGHYNLDLHHLHAPDPQELPDQFNALITFYQ